MESRWSPPPASAVSTKERLGYTPALDGLRGLAALFILLHHGATGFFPSGYYGVDMFFVLSGFLITTLLLEEFDGTRTIAIRRFFARRALRLLPAMLFAIVGAIVLVAVFPPDEAPLRKVLHDIPFSLFYISDIRQGMMHQRIPVLGHTWSLSIEEHFYIIWPIILLFAAKRGGYRAVRAVAILGTLTVLTLRLYLTSSQDGMYMYFSPQTHSDTILLGCVLATLRWDGTFASFLQKYGSRLALFGLLVMVPLTMYQPPQGIAFAVVAGFTLTGLATAGVVAGTLANPHNGITKFLRSSVLVKVGKLSYGAYLWNYVLVSTIGPHLDDLPGVVRFCLLIAMTFAMAQLSATFIEAPFMRLKRRMTTAPISTETR